MNLVTPTRRANAYPAGGESDRDSITIDSLTRAIGMTSMEVDLNTLSFVTGRAHNSQESWYTFGFQEEGAHEAVSGYDDCPISGPRTMFRGSVSGGDPMVTSEVERHDFNAAVTPFGGICAENGISRDLHGQMKRSGLFPDKQVSFSVLSGGGSS